MSDPIYEKLKEYEKKGVLPMHMPGHKRRVGDFPHLPSDACSVDITEIDGFDDLGDPRGIIKESEEIASRLWGSKRTFYSVNGSTACVLAAICALCPPGGRAVVARNCHKSVYSALELFDITPVFVLPETAADGDGGSVTPEAVDDALRSAPDASVVIVTSPTYGGIISDIRGIVRAARARGVPVVVDEAHGAHLGLHPFFPEGAVACGADVVIHSLHKTLASLTGTAALHVCGELKDADAIGRMMAAFVTSSPSYILLSSIDGEVRRLAKSGGRLARWAAALEKMRDDLAGLRVLSAADRASDGAAFAADPSKITLDCSRAGLTGPALAAALRKEGVEVEAALPYGVLAMTGEGDTEKTLLRFARAALAVDRTLLPSDPVPPVPLVTVPPRVLSSREALKKKKRRVPLGSAVGKVSATYVWAYPPGVPAVVPGETVTDAVVGIIKRYLAAGIALKGVDDGTTEIIEY
ncbi:MAG: aminotransferase class I/II-fold pyridoxal phosphate-dependent enzyme [Clostridia bacterium]|nr:aminotransferase class I/II-fold pyridoxal phosphate-dependent enzyme [Clostridia bacterium]